MTRPLSYYVAPAILLLAVLAGAGNWYLRPDRAVAWAVGMFSVPVLWGVATLVIRYISRSTNGAARRQASGAIRRGIVFAGLIILTSLSLTLATSLGVIGDSDMSQRVTMIILAAFFVFTGNAMPKMLTPLSAMQCDGARTQAFQRLAGWTWVLMGLAFALVWIVLPVDLAQPVSLLTMLVGMLTFVVQVVRLRRSRGTTPPAEV